MGNSPLVRTIQSKWDLKSLRNQSDKKDNDNKLEAVAVYKPNSALSLTDGIRKAFPKKIIEERQMSPFSSVEAAHARCGIPLQVAQSLRIVLR